MGVIIGLFDIAVGVSGFIGAATIAKKHRYTSKSVTNWQTRVSQPSHKYTSGKNHFHEMNGDVGMAGWK